MIDLIVEESDSFEKVVLNEKTVLKKRKREYNAEEKKHLLETEKIDDICKTKIADLVAEEVGEIENSIEKDFFSGLNTMDIN